MIFYLPNEIIIIIFSYLNEKEINEIGIVCKKFYQLTHDESLW